MTDKPTDARLGGKRPQNALPLGVKTHEAKNKALARVFNVVILIVIGFGFYQFVSKGGDAGVLSDLGAKLDVIDAPQEGDPRIDRLMAEALHPSPINRLFPIQRPAVKVQQLQEGQGAPAFCGQDVTYRLISGAGSNQTVSEPQMMRLGEKSKPQGLTLGLEGMRVGEVRKILIPQPLWDGSRPLEGEMMSSAELTVELQSIKGDVPQGELALRRFIRKAGSGDPLRCGDLAILHLRLWSGSQSEPLFTSAADKPVYFFIGEGKVPYGIERGVQDMAAGGDYSLVLTPDYLKPLQPEGDAIASVPFKADPFPTDLILPQDQLLLVDVSYPATPPAMVPVKVPVQVSPKATTQPLPESSIPATEPEILPEPEIPTLKTEIE